MTLFNGSFLVIITQTSFYNEKRAIMNPISAFTKILLEDTFGRVAKVVTVHDDLLTHSC